MMLDVVVRYQYCGHHGRSHVPPAMKGKERRLRITVDESRSAAQIRDEVMHRKDVLPPPNQFLGGETKTHSGFEMADKDLVKWVSPGLPVCTTLFASVHKNGYLHEKSKQLLVAYRYVYFYIGNLNSN